MLRRHHTEAESCSPPDRRVEEWSQAVDSQPSAWASLAVQLQPGGVQAALPSLMSLHTVEHCAFQTGVYTFAVQHAEACRACACCLSKEWVPAATGHNQQLMPWTAWPCWCGSQLSAAHMQHWPANRAHLQPAEEVLAQGHWEACKPCRTRLSTYIRHLYKPPSQPHGHRAALQSTSSLAVQQQQR